jgi:hypothetical protein
LVPIGMTVPFVPVLQRSPDHVVGD